MKHHFADFLDREGGYWTMLPNDQRYAHFIEEEIVDKDAATIATIGKQNELWQQVFDFPHLEELTLHEPSKEQLLSLEKLPQLKRLRITHARPENINFLQSLEHLEELVLEYVSGFSDLSPLVNLKKLKAVHFENLRRVSDFGGLAGSKSLKFLHIDGTLDWKQPIKDFYFLAELLNLEVFSLGWVTNKSDYPALAPIVHLQQLKKIRIIRCMFTTKEYAFLETALPGVQGATWELFREYEDWIEFLGLRAGRIKSNNPLLKEKCDAFAQQYADMKEKARHLLEAMKIQSN